MKIKFFQKPRSAFRTAVHTTVEWAGRKRYLIGGLFVGFILLFCGCSYVSSQFTSRTLLLLHYEQAPDGLNPNDTRFNMDELTSDEVMEKALAYAGLTGAYTPQELADCISVQAESASVTDSSMFISTTYRITFQDKLRARGHKASVMLNLVCKAYREYFVAHYADNQAILAFSDDSFFSEEYLMQVDRISIRANQLKRYVSDRMEEAGNYQDEITGEGFASLEKRLDNFLHFDVENLSSFILESGIAHDKKDLLAILDYKIRMSTMQYDRLIASYEADNEGIRLYDHAMSAVVLIPTTDEDQQYYMSRTKTGMDDLAAHADEQLTRATETMKNIRYDQYVMQQMKENAPKTAQKAKADQMIETMTAYLDELAGTIQQVDASYMQSKTSDYLTFHSDDMSFLQRLELTDAFIRALMLLILLLAVRTFWLWIKQGWKQKEKNGE